MTPLVHFGNIHYSAYISQCVLPDDTSKKLISGDWKYRVASAEQVQEVIASRSQRAAKVSHIEQLLRTLPTALEHSIAASNDLAEKMLNGEDGDLTELGVMIVEQHRIRREIAKQTALLDNYNNTPLPAKICPIFKRPDLTRTTHRRLFISSSPCWEACFTCRFSRNPQLLPHLSFPFRSCLLLRMISHLLSPLPSPLFGLGAHPLRISVRVQSARGA